MFDALLLATAMSSSEHSPVSSWDSYSASDGSTTTSIGDGGDDIAAKQTRRPKHRGCRLEESRQAEAPQTLPVGEQ